MSIQVEHEETIAVQPVVRSRSCTAIESAIEWISHSFGSIGPFDWLKLPNADSLCMKCSICLQSQGAVESKIIEF